MEDRVLSQTDVVQHPIGSELDSTRQRVHDLSFSALLQELRIARGWTKADLAKRSGFDPSSITRFEQGSRAPERDTVMQLADAMALPMTDRDRLLAAAGFRSEIWDDPLLVELAQVLGESSLPAAAKNEVRSVIRMAIAYCRLQRLEAF
ncbi:MAG: helix-turn-helix transcriptional regulator [Thermomicrobiales bacterium]